MSRAMPVKNRAPWRVGPAPTARAPAGNVEPSRRARSSRTSCRRAARRSRVDANVEQHALGQRDRQRLADRLGGGPAEQPFGARIPVADHAVVVDRDDAFDGGLGDRPEPQLAVAQRVLRALARGDVAIDLEKALRRAALGARQRPAAFDGEARAVSSSSARPRLPSSRVDDLLLDLRERLWILGAQQLVRHGAERLLAAVQPYMSAAPALQ